MNQVSNLPLVQQLDRKRIAKNKIKSLPFKRAKHDGSRSSTANTTGAAAVEVGPEDSHGDKAGEPEDHGDELSAENAELVGGIGIVGWAEDEVGKRQYGPDGCEEEKVDC